MVLKSEVFNQASISIWDFQMAAGNYSELLEESQLFPPF